MSGSYIQLKNVKYIDKLNKYENEKDKPLLDGFIKFPNELFSFDRYSANELGLFAAIQMQLSYMKIGELTFTPMTSMKMLLVSLGVKVTKSNIEVIETTLTSLIQDGHVRKANSKMVGKDEYFQLAIKTADTNFTIVDLQSLYTIIGKADKINILPKIAAYVTVLSLIFNSETADNDGVCVRKRDDILERSKLPRQSAQRYLDELTDMKVLSYFKIRTAPPYNYTKKIYSTFHNRNKLIHYTAKMMNNNHFVEIIE